MAPTPKQDVPQGTLALMVLRTLDVLGPLHGYGIGRRIEEISSHSITLIRNTLVGGEATLETEDEAVHVDDLDPIVGEIPVVERKK